jgi:hypothetical protein
VILATAELRDGARDQRERLVRTTGKSVGSAEGRRDIGCRDDDLPRPAEVETPLKDAGRVWEIPATEVGAPEIEQPEVQRQGMIRRFSDPHGSLGVPDGLVEPADLGKRVGKVGPREHGLDGDRPETLGAEIALERDVPLEEGDRIAELAPGDVRHAQEGRCDDFD